MCLCTMFHLINQIIENRLSYNCLKCAVFLCLVTQYLLLLLEIDRFYIDLLIMDVEYNNDTYIFSA